MDKKPSEYTRVTERFGVAEVEPELREQIRERAERSGLDADPLAGAVEGVRTRSEPMRGGGLLRRRRAAKLESRHLIAGDLLVLLAREEGSDWTVDLYRLRDAEVAEFSSPLIDDSGVELTGPPLGGTERSVRFLPLDRTPAGIGFRDALAAAVAAAS